MRTTPGLRGVPCLESIGLSACGVDLRGPAAKHRNYFLVRAGTTENLRCTEFWRQQG